MNYPHNQSDLQQYNNYYHNYYHQQHHHYPSQYHPYSYGPNTIHVYPQNIYHQQYSQINYPQQAPPQPNYHQHHYPQYHQYHHYQQPQPGPPPAEPYCDQDEGYSTAQYFDYERSQEESRHLADTNRNEENNLVHETELSSNTLNYSQFDQDSDDDDDYDDRRTHEQQHGNYDDRIGYEQQHGHYEDRRVQEQGHGHYDNLWQTQANRHNDYPYELNKDDNPEIITKKNDRVIDYTQEVAVRYLKPPTPPPPGDIVIRQEPDIVAKPPSPLILREYPERPPTPEPIVIREKPPKPPSPVGTKLITISGKEVVPPRQVIIEKCPPMPPRPPPIIVERWLPYPKSKRKIILEKAKEGCVLPKPKNVLIEWDPPDVEIEREYKNLGVCEVDPNEYKEKFGPNLVNLSQMPKFLQDIPPPPSEQLNATEHSNKDGSTFLEGDIEALALIDLDQHGLTQYKDELRRRGLARI